MPCFSKCSTKITDDEFDEIQTELAKAEFDGLPEKPRQLNPLSLNQFK